MSNERKNYTNTQNAWCLVDPNKGNRFVSKRFSEAYTHAPMFWIEIFEQYQRMRIQADPNSRCHFHAYVLPEYCDWCYLCDFQCVRDNTKGPWQCSKTITKWCSPVSKISTKILNIYTLFVSYTPCVRVYPNENTNMENSKRTKNKLLAYLRGGGCVSISHILYLLFSVMG